MGKLSWAVVAVVLSVVMGLALRARAAEERELWFTSVEDGSMWVGSMASGAVCGQVAEMLTSSLVESGTSGILNCRAQHIEQH